VTDRRVLSEFVGGLLLALGLLTRPAATFVLITLTVAAVDIHSGDPFAKRELALAYAVVALSLMLGGGGRYSLDRALFWRSQDRP
jgi:putative oxidoreductase